MPRANLADWTAPGTRRVADWVVQYDQEAQRPLRCEFGRGFEGIAMQNASQEVNEPQQQDMVPFLTNERRYLVNLG